MGGGGGGWGGGARVNNCFFFTYNLNQKKHFVSEGGVLE